MNDGVMEFTAHLNCTSSDGRKQVLGLNIKIRQYLEDVLQYLSGMYEICVFTAGEQEYADTVLDLIDHEYSIIKHRLYRQHCV
jgi:CTD small phosphatase-like protein 2